MAKQTIQISRSETGEICVHRIENLKPNYSSRGDGTVQGISWACKRCGRTGLPVAILNLDTWSRRMARDIREYRESMEDDDG